MRILTLALLLTLTVLAVPQPTQPRADLALDGRTFLLYDESGDGRAIEVIGDLAGATHIAVLIPGVDTTLRNFDRGLGGVRRRAPAVQARKLYDAITGPTGPRSQTAPPHAGASTTPRMTSKSAISTNASSTATLPAPSTKPAPHGAVIAWLGYDPPEGISLDAARDARARAGADALVNFVNGLPSQAAVTLVGHSYGALVAGLAAPRLSRVADVVALGAVGMGVDSASDLGGARVWSALAADDWIRRIPQARLGPIGHGRRPSNPRFGATALPTDGVSGHDGYLCAGTGTIRAVADIVIGRAGGLA